MYDAETDGILVKVDPQYMESESSPEEHHFLWSYTVEIENRSSKTVQLQTRYWQITDAMGQVQEVQGPGVVGQQPILKPGDKFRYTSGCPLSTPSGFMTGSYQMQDDNGEMFDVRIPLFSLDSPHQHRMVN